MKDNKDKIVNGRVAGKHKILIKDIWINLI